MTAFKSQIETSDLENARKKALKNNLESAYAKKILRLFICPYDKLKLSYKNDYMECEKGHRIPIKNGIPDFVSFNKNMTDEKIKQIAFHDDEEINERFEEIVLRRTIMIRYTQILHCIISKHLKKITCQVGY